jgi:hypothetical protein
MDSSGVTGVFLLLVCMFIYFGPSIVAEMNEKKQKWAIVVLNALLGWTVIGWVVAMVWAVMKD